MAEFEFSERDQVRYSDCDMHAHMNNARYLSFMEQGRIGFMRAVGLQPTSRKESIPFLLVHASCDYRAPALLGDEIETAIHVAQFGRTSFTMVYRMTRRHDGAVLAEGKTVQVMFDYVTERPIPVTDDFKQQVWALQDRARVRRAETV